MLPNIEGITPRKAPAEYWARPDKGKDNIRSAQCENALFPWKGKKYVVIYAYCTIDGYYRERYGVRLVTKKNKGTGSTFFYFMGLDRTSPNLP